MKTPGFALLILAFLSSYASASENPFVGSWKFDAARSRLVAETIEYTDAGNGRMHVSNGATSDYDFALDGKQYKAGDDRTIAWKEIGPGRWRTTFRISGRITETASRALSPQGDELVVVASGVLPDGSAYKHEKHYARIGSGKGLAGRWRNVRMDTNNMADGYVISEDAAGVITWAIPTDKQALTGRFDGSDMLLTGPSAPANTVFAVDRISSHKIAYVMKTNGKPGQYGTVAISDDGNVFTEESWLPGKESDKSTGVFVRYRCPPSGRVVAGDPEWLCPAPQ